MSRSLHHRVASIVESTYGETPSPNPELDVLECNTAGGVINAPKVPSAVSRNDGNVKDTVPVNYSGSFSRTQDLVFPTVDEGLFREIRAGLRDAAEVATVDAVPSGAVVLEPSGDGNTITQVAAQFVVDGFRINDVVRVVGATNAADNGCHRVTAVAAGTLTVAHSGPTGAWISVPGTPSALWRGARMVNGVTDRSFSIEEAWLDTQKMTVWTGQVVSSLSFGFSMGSKSMISIGYVGKDGDPDTAMASASVGITGSTLDPYTESPVFTPKDPVRVEVNGTAVPCQSASVTISAGARNRWSSTGGATPDATPTGLCRVSVSLTAYAAVLTQLTEHRDGTSFPMMISMDDPDGKAIAVVLGSVRWDSASLPMPGVDQDAMVTVTGTATLTDEAEDYTVQFFRFV